MWVRVGGAVRRRDGAAGPKDIKRQVGRVGDGVGRALEPFKLQKHQIKRLFFGLFPGTAEDHQRRPAGETEDQRQDGQEVVGGTGGKGRNVLIFMPFFGGQ